MQKVVLTLSLIFLFKLTAGQNYGIDTSNFDKSVSPGADFYKYVNGKWLASNPIPADRSSWGIFDGLDQLVESRIHTLVASIAADTSSEAGSNRHKIRDYYVAAADSSAINRKGAAPLVPLLLKIDSIKNRTDLARVIGWLELNFCNAGFRFYAGSDPQNALRSIAHIDQYGGYSLPNPGYYLSDDPEFVSIRNRYALHIEKMMMLAGYNPANSKDIARSVLKIETILAINGMPNEEFRTASNASSKISLRSLQKIAPHFNWTSYFSALGVSSTEEINVLPPSFFTAFSEAIRKNDLAEWKRYLAWCVVHNAAPYLSSDFVREDFDFFSASLYGVKEQRSHKKRTLDHLKANLGWALAEEYITLYFSVQEKIAAERMIESIRSTFHQRLAKNEWLSDQTKAYAIEKLERIEVMVAYPDVWPDLSSLEISPFEPLQNVISCWKYEMAKQASQCGKAIDRKAWGMTPQTVNAYYNPSQNVIVLPASILQPPIFSPYFDPAVNYGGLGAVVAHEFTHAFDDEGSHYDAVGNLRNWWSESDMKAFRQKQQLIIEQYNGYIILDSIALNGALTVGENIADLGGLTIAYHAFKNDFVKKDILPVIDGLTPEKRFFIAWAQLWRQNKTPEALKLQVETRTSSPNKFRVNGPLSNMDEFIEAFQIKEGEPMARPSKVRFTIW